MKEKISQIERGQMKRSLGVFDLFAIGYGDLGSSIYYALGITAFYALGATPLALLCAGLVFVCTALTYAEMSSVIPEAGGSASYSRKAFNDLISFIAGWGLLLDYIVTIAISSFSVPPYLSYFIPALRDVWAQTGLTIFIIVAMLFINIRGTKHSTRISMVLTGLALLTQIACSDGIEANIYPFGQAIERNQANFFSADTTSVKSYPPNSIGLYDMAGNVYEWCEDWYSYNYYHHSEQEPDNPQGPPQGVYRVLRGGCWKSLKEDLRCSHRHRNNPGTMTRTYGFRLAADVE